MGIFGRKSSVVLEPVAFDRGQAVNLTNVQNLQADLVAVAARLDWPDRSVPSPVIQADLRPGVSTYGKEAVGVWVGKTCIGYLGGPASRATTATRAAVVLERHGSALIGFACPVA
jgi:hypothetical protein